MIRRRLTGKNEEDNPVHNQHGPKDGDVEHLEPTAQKRDADGSGGPVPELELGESSDEGLELLILLGGESAHGAILHLIVHLFVRGVKLGLQEGQEQVQKVDSKRIGNCAVLVASLGVEGVPGMKAYRCTSPARTGFEGRRGRGRRRCRPIGRGQRGSTGPAELGSATVKVSTESLLPWVHPEDIHARSWMCGR